MFGTPPMRLVATFVGGALLGATSVALLGPGQLARAGADLRDSAPRPPAAMGAPAHARAASVRVGQAEEGRVTGIGGVFFLADDPASLRAWYAEHLGMDVGPNGADFLWRERGQQGRPGRTVWNAFPRETDYFGPGGQELMVNFVVDDLEALLVRLRERGVEPVKPLESYPYGRFAWIVDGEGNRVELWEPPESRPAVPDTPPGAALD